MELAIRKCRICDSEAPCDVYDVREMMFGVGESFRYFACASCGCLQIEAFPDDMGKYYPKRYYSFASEAPRRAGVRARLARERLQSAAGGRFSLVGAALSLLRPLPDLAAIGRLRVSPGASICDVGCGSGSLLFRMRSIGFTSLTGADPFVEEEVSLPGLRIHRATIEQLDGRYDLIMFHHSFEHLREPTRVLSCVKARLSQEGRCLIRIPTVSSWAWEHYREHWIQLDAPRHFFLHSTRSLAVLADRTGFEITDLWFDSTPLQFLSELYAAGISLEASGHTTRSRAKRLLDFPAEVVRDIRARRLNRYRRGDSVAVVLKQKVA